ncbi:portal protein [Aromatoleum anaerobium]|uniref:Portal protein n=1 Tax=Aromatoleum anaerobium TaxID=182180 RepID=A0ABX1PT69_9RHOO|nr:hypothetical protein [Aromatoleum anaerobium]MCK0507916.1 hypothetical protein [Aromatoleum anaerobium]
MDMTDNGTQAVAPAPVDWLGLARNAYDMSTTWFDASVRRDIEQDIRQFQSRHPMGSKYSSDAYAARSRLFRPKTRSAIRKNEAVAAEAFFSTQDVVSIAAHDESDPVQRAAAELMQQMLQWRLTKTIPWFLTVCGAYQDAQAVGVVASHQHWEFDPRRGTDKPVIDLVPVENLRIDPAAKWDDPIGSSPYVIHLLPMYVKDVRARMSQADAKTGQAWRQVSDAEILSATKGYGDSTRITREGGRQDSKDQASTINDFTIVWVHRNIVEMDGQDWLYYTLGTTQVLSDPVPLDSVYHHGLRPYVMGCAVLETHKTYPSSLPRLSRDTQSEINDLANLRIDNIRFVLNKRYFVKRNKQVDLRSLTRNTPGSATLMDDPESDVKAVDFHDVTSSAYQEQDRLNLDFDDVTGSFSQSTVQSNRRLNETVGGLNLLTSNANQVSGYQLRTFVETWVEPVLRQLIALEKAYETDENILTLAGKRAKIDETYGLQNIAEVFDLLLDQDMLLTVNVGMGATNPHDQVKNFMAGIESLRAVLADGVMERYGLKVDEVIREIFGKLGYKDGGRFFDMENEDPRVTALKNTVSELQQTLAQKQDPALVAKQIEKLDAEIEKIKATSVETGTKSFFSAMQAGQVVASMPQVAPVADEILKGAGYQPIPGGVDPNIVAPPAPMLPEETMLTGAPGDTSPNTPMSPESGALDGIETMEADSV